MLPKDITELAEAVLAACRDKGLKIATAESCTGGLIAGCLTEIAGSSDVVERGFVTYSNLAKAEMLGVSPEVLDNAGAVSEETARAMAEGALARSAADMAVAVTGIAGPGGATPTKPVGRVHIAIARRDGETRHHRLDCGDIGRDKVRAETVRVALRMMLDRASEGWSASQ